MGEKPAGGAREDRGGEGKTMTEIQRDRQSPTDKEDTGRGIETSGNNKAQREARGIFGKTEQRLRERTRRW